MQLPVGADLVEEAARPVDCPRRGDAEGESAALEGGAGRLLPQHVPVAGRERIDGAALGRRVDDAAGEEGRRVDGVVELRAPLLAEVGHRRGAQRGRDDRIVEPAVVSVREPVAVVGAGSRRARTAGRARHEEHGEKRDRRPRGHSRNLNGHGR